jgi:hypothetical protein
VVVTPELTIVEKPDAIVLTLAASTAFAIVCMFARHVFFCASPIALT